MNPKAVLFCVAAATFSGSALAEEPAGAYFGPVIGATDIRFDLGSGYTYSSTPIAWGLDAGWRFNQFVSVEVGYLEVKKMHESGTVGANAFAATARLDGWTVSGLFSLPVSDAWSLYAKLGGIRDHEYHALYPNGAPAVYSAGHYGKFVYGGGLAVMIDGARVRLEYAHSDLDYGKGSLYSLRVNWFIGGKN